MLPTKFRVKWPFSPGEEAKNWFSRWLSWRPLGFLIGMILAIFDLKITLMLTTQFEVNKPFGSGEEVKNRFQDGRHSGHLGFPIGTILAIFDLCHPDASYQVSSQLAFGFMRRSEKRLSRWPPWRPSWISDQHDFSIFWFTSHCDASYQVWSQLAFRLRS